MLTARHLAPHVRSAKRECLAGARGHPVDSLRLLLLADRRPLPHAQHKPRYGMRAFPRARRLELHERSLSRATEGFVTASRAHSTRTRLGLHERASPLSPEGFVVAMSERIIACEAPILPCIQLTRTPPLLCRHPLHRARDQPSGRRGRDAHGGALRVRCRQLPLHVHALLPSAHH